ncbi:hypothetical protein OIU84_011821 [Salix udensis]|uniref:Wax synthase domain-containing protein n=1 Tax=Salix udensis TaxID=889485 RepID=A0AAD6NXF9_9ROSI|nr:hypothetical protein OIU84_011821 [Salix udensis]
MTKGLARVLFLLPTFYLLAIFPWNFLDFVAVAIFPSQDPGKYSPFLANHGGKNVLVGFVGAGKARVLAMVTTLVISGVMHELMFYYISCGDETHMGGHLVLRLARYFHGFRGCIEVFGSGQGLDTGSPDCFKCSDTCVCVIHIFLVSCAACMEEWTK